MAMSIVDADPFGFYLRQLITADEAFLFIVRTARKHGVPDDKVKVFFEDYHQYYQADFSSYSSASEYQTPTGEKMVGQETSLAKYLEKESPIAADDGSVSSRSQLKFDEGSRGFQYADAQPYKTRFATLQAMFATPQGIREKFDALVSAEKSLEASKNQRRFAEPVT